MKKARLFTLLLALPLLSGCGHEHTFATEWSFTDATHYHAATCEHTDLKSDEGSHNFYNGFCSVCGFQEPHVHTFSTSWTNNESMHWHDSTCGHDVKSDEGEHVFVDGVCSECGYKQGIPPHVHTFSETWNSDGTMHWHDSTCGHDVISDGSEHNFVDGYCSVCGFKQHVHTFSDIWSTDEEKHWHYATCGHNLISNEGPHNFVDGVCSVCGFKPHEHTFSETWSTNEEIHWHDSTCGHDVKSSEGPHNFVDGACSVCGYKQSIPPHIHTFSKAWSSDETGHWHAATCEHTDLKTDFSKHTFKNGKCTVCGFSDPTYQAWTDAEIQIFEKHLYGFVLPCVKDLKAEWDSDQSCVLVYGAAVTHDSFNAYVDSVVARGFEKQEGPYEDTYILLKELVVDGKKRTIDIDIFIDDDGYLYAICYDPFIYEWPTETVAYLYENCFYIAPTVKVPSIVADRYFVFTNYMDSDSILEIDCFSDTNLEEAYKTALIESGFSVSDVRDESGALVATEPQNISKVLFAYSDTEKALSIVIMPGENGWPAFVVDYYTDQLTSSSGTRVPAVIGAKSCEFIDVYNRYHYFFVLCESDFDLTRSYEASLDEHYTLYNETKNAAGNYWAISDNNDLLVQYVYIVTESPFGGEDYKHFDVLFEDYHPHNEEHINAGLQIINEGTKTTLPAYPGYGERIDFSDSDIYMTVTIQASTFDSMSQYMSILDEAGWSVKDISSLLYNYEAISPDRDIRLESSIVDGRMTLTLSAYEDPYSDWPVEGINEIFESLGIEGEVPVFDGAYGYDYENDEYNHDIVCIVKTNKEEDLVDAYIEKLTGLGWKHIVEGDFDYYVKEGSDVGLVPYFEREGTGYCFIEIIHGDGTKYDIDARTAFVDWKIYFDIKSNIQIPGIILNNNVANIELAIDAGETYEYFYLFRLNVELTDGEVVTAISTINSIFENADWVYSSDDHYYHKEDMWLNAHEIDGKVVIDICSPIPMNDLETLVKRFVFDEELTEWIVVPGDFNIADEYELVVSKYDVDYVICNSTLTFDSYDAALAAKTAILNAFKSKDWVQPGSNPDELQDNEMIPSLKVVLSLDDDSNILQFSIVSPYSY